MAIAIPRPPEHLPRPIRLIVAQYSNWAVHWPLWDCGLPSEHNLSRYALRSFGQYIMPDCLINTETEVQYFPKPSSLPLFYDPLCYSGLASGWSR